MPAYDEPVGQRPIDADAAKLAVTLRALSRRLRRARWIPWRRRKRAQLRAQINELTRHRQQQPGAR